MVTHSHVNSPLSNPHTESPTTPLPKRPRAKAEAFHPVSRRPLLPPTHDIGVPPDALSQIAMRQQSNVLALVRPAQLDELLTLQGEIHCNILCMHGIPDGARESVEELAARLGTVLGALTSGPTPIRVYYRFGRFSPDRPCPVIVRFLTMNAKVTVLCTKGVLYCPECPEALHGIRVYHDLSVQ